MSLVGLIRRPDVREAFDRLATPERTPAHMRGLPLLVPDGGGPQGLAGTAFDLVARAQIARDLRKPGVTFHERDRTGSRIEDHLEMVPLHPEHEVRIRDGIRTAQREAADYAAGRGDLGRLIEQAQYYALAEMAYRSSSIPNGEFRPMQSVSDELMRLIELFAPGARYAPKTLCILNPGFISGRWVGGADADLVVDATLVDLKTTAKPGVAVDMLRQLAGYAALQVIGGIETDGDPHTAPFEKVELYFARYGATATWTVGELFPGGGFEEFCRIVREIADENHKQFDAMMDRINRRSAEEAEQKKLARAKARKKRKAKKATQKPSARKGSSR